MLFTKPLLALALAAQAQAATIKITGYANATSYYFLPNSVTAAVGDILEFHFMPKNHSIAAGDFANPCKPPASGGFFSGYNFFTNSSEASKVFKVTVNDTNPMVAYCTQGNHCFNGMAVVVNPSGDKTIENYMAAAKAANVVPAVAPASVGGGVLADNANATTSSPSSTTSAPASTSSTPSGAGMLQVSLASVLGLAVFAAMMA